MSVAMVCFYRDWYPGKKRAFGAIADTTTAFIAYTERYGYNATVAAYQYLIRSNSFIAVVGIENMLSLSRHDKIATRPFQTLHGQIESKTEQARGQRERERGQLNVAKVRLFFSLLENIHPEHISVHNFVSILQIVSEYYSIGNSV